MIWQCLHAMTLVGVVLVVGCYSRVADRTGHTDRAGDSSGETAQRLESAALTETTTTTEINVDSRRDWQDTGVEVLPGAKITIRAKGAYDFGRGIEIGPNGLHDRPDARPFLGSWPVNHLTGLALIGRIGKDGDPFLVGEEMETVTYEEGHLFLTVNDDFREVNNGKLNVHIEVSVLAYQTQ